MGATGYVSMRKLNYDSILVFLFLVSVFLLGLCKIDDTDAWTHLNFGRLIWETKSLPGFEPFVFPVFGTPFSYSEWLFGIIYYLAYLGFGVYGVILLKTTAITAGFYLLLKDSLRPYGNLVISIALMTVAVIAARYRFVERPDTFLLLFLSFSVFSLNAFFYDNKKYLYALPVVHVIWANMHTSIILMVVPFLAFIAGGVLQRYFSQRGMTEVPYPTKFQLITITLVFLASLGASLLSPHSLDQYVGGANFVVSGWIDTMGGQVSTPAWAIGTVAELRPPDWATFKTPYFLTAGLIISFLVNRKRFSPIHFLLVIPFIVLSFTAIRFIFLLGVISGPVMARNFSEYLDMSKKWTTLIPHKVLTGIVLVWIILYTFLGMAEAWPFYRHFPEKRFGFGFNTRRMPEGALRYMDRGNITGKIFNKPEWGQYVVWRDFPKRTVFADGRFGLPLDLLQKMRVAGRVPSVLDELHEKYGFEAVLLGYSEDAAETNYTVDAVLRNPGWALVYWDDVSLLYLKKGGIYDSLIRRDEYKYIKPGNRLDAIAENFKNEDFRNKLVSEIKRNIHETGSARAYELLGFVYNETGLYREALASFSTALSHPDANLFDVYNWMAFSYVNLGDFDHALEYYGKALKIQKDEYTYYHIGLIYLEKGDGKKAAKHFSRALELNSDFIEAYQPLLDTYRKLGMEREARTLSMQYEKSARTRK